VPFFALSVFVYRIVFAIGADNAKGGSSYSGTSKRTQRLIGFGIGNGIGIEGIHYNPLMALAQLGILISGTGSNMKSIVAACEGGEVPAEVAIVISNRADAPGIEWAAEHGLETAILSHRDYPDREAHDLAIVEQLDEAKVEWVCLAGYMRLLSAAFVSAYPNRILNIHPALLPSFPGLHGQEQAWKYGVKVSGCTVHLVDLELDHGPIVIQRSVPVLDDDDEERLSARILEQEHIAYPEALRALLTQSWSLDGRRVIFT
jgi:phosphoribosylglycinamide formyltransferase-1